MSCQIRVRYGQHGRDLHLQANIMAWGCQDVHKHVRDILHLAEGHSTPSSHLKKVLASLPSCALQSWGQSGLHGWAVQSAELIEIADCSVAPCKLLMPDQVYGSLLAEGTSSLTTGSGPT